MKNLQSALVRNFWALPVLYIVVAVFLLRHHVGYVYLAVGVLVLLAALAQHYADSVKPEVRLARWMSVFAAIGVSASFILSIEKVELLSEPAYITSCSLSPIVSCSPVIQSWQASAFGIPNSFIGIFGFTAVLSAALTIAAGAIKLTRTWWRTLIAGLIFAVGFSLWLMYQGVFDIGKLCLYCMLVWLATTALLWLTVAHGIRSGYVSLGDRFNKVLVRDVEIIMVTYLAIFILLFLRWFDYWTLVFR